MKFWLQRNGLWHLVLELDIKAEKTAGALKTAMSLDVRVFVMENEDNPIFIWETLSKMHWWNLYLVKLKL